MKVTIVTVELEHPATEPGRYSVGRIELSPVRNVCVYIQRVLLLEFVLLIEFVLLLEFVLLRECVLIR